MCVRKIVGKVVEENAESQTKQDSLGIDNALLQSMMVFYVS